MISLNQENKWVKYFINENKSIIFILDESQKIVKKIYSNEFSKIKLEVLNRLNNNYYISEISLNIIINKENDFILPLDDISLHTHLKNLINDITLKNYELRSWDDNLSIELKDYNSFYFDNYEEAKEIANSRWNKFVKKWQGKIEIYDIDGKAIVHMSNSMYYLDKERNNEL